MTEIPNVRHADVCRCAKCVAKANRRAIRRAATVARRYEQRAAESRDIITRGINLNTAIGIRVAIRAALEEARS